MPWNSCATMSNEQTRSVRHLMSQIMSSECNIMSELFAISSKFSDLIFFYQNKKIINKLTGRFIVFLSLWSIQMLSWTSWKVSWMPYKNSWLPYKISWMPYKSQTWMPYKFSWMPYKISWMPYKSHRDQKCSVWGLPCLLCTPIPSPPWNR